MSSVTCSIKIDIINALLLIREIFPHDEIDHFIGDALAGDILDKKASKKSPEECDKGRDKLLLSIDV